MTLITIHILGARIGGGIQILFSFLKIVPLLAGIALSVAGFTPAHFYYAAADAIGSFQTIPLALFASFGFEIICSIGHLVQEPERYLKPIIITTFFVVMSCNILFQLVLYGALGAELAHSAAPLLLLASHQTGAAFYFLTLCNSFVFTAIIGSCFSVFTSNVWNLHALSAHGHFPGQRYLTALTTTQVPWVSLIVQGLLACLFLWLTVAQVSLQNMAVFGQIIAHFFTAWAALRAVKLGLLPGLRPWVSCSSAS